MKKLVVSIIIPSYNSEKYLEKCINSIINQTYKNFEIIIVDDCSKDNSFNLATKLSQIDSRIKVFKNDENKGAAYTRNFALTKAIGKYISFVDADDYLETNFYENLINDLEKQKADLAICDIYVRNETTGEDVRNIVCNGDVNKINIINNGLCASPCNKIYKKELLLKYNFPENIINEDIPTIIPIILYAEKIVYNTDTYYNYIQHDASVQNSHLSIKKLDIFKALDITKERTSVIHNFDEIWDIIIYNELICFLLYAVASEKNIGLRYNFMKNSLRYLKKYNILNNNQLKKTLNKSGRKTRTFYKIYLSLYQKRCLILCNILIEFVNILKRLISKNVIKKNININDLIKEAKKQKNKTSDILISAVIPNYNYSKFLYERIYSILYQTEKINEIIILDDCSSDDSKEVIDNLVNELSPYINIRKYYNDVNSGTTFKQWNKAFNLAKSDYIWIAEADDYCNKNMIKLLANIIKENKNISLAYVDTALINKTGKIIMKSIKPEIDINKTGHWNNNYINDGIDEITNYEYLNCTIANVSSVLFKKNNYENILKECQNYKQAGDYYFYLNVMEKGNVAFINKPLNYYRVHGNNVTSQTKKQLHLKEIKKIHAFIEKKYGLNENQKQNIQKRYDYLKSVWNLK